MESHGALPRPSFERPTRVLLVVAPFYRDVADALLAGAGAALDDARVHHETVEVPGALEVPTTILGFVALGCVIRGETSHYETVCSDSSRGLTLLGLDGVCIGNGILTVENHAQAAVRADPAGQNKGGGAADAALQLIALARRVAPPARPVPEGSVRVAGPAKSGGA